MASKTAEIWPDRATHPGVYLKLEIQARGMTQTELSQRMERPNQVINEIIRGKKSVSSETALGLERVLGTPAHVWVNLQSHYELVKARHSQHEKLVAQKDWLKRFPVKEMIKRGWIEDGDPVAERVSSLLGYFGIQSFDQWEKPSEALAYRITPRAKVDEYALGTWLRRGEIEGHETPVEPYNSKRFHHVLRQIRGLTAAPGFWPEMRRLCATAGVALVCVPDFPKTGANGVAHWLTGNKALIQLNLRYRWADIFWFTFFHEAHHVLAKGPKRTFVDLKNGMARDEAELAADRFAADFLIPPALWDSFVSTDVSPDSEDAVKSFAATAGVDAGVVVGRLQHEGIIGHKDLNGLRPQLNYA